VDEAFASIGTHHATPSFEAFELLIALATSLVFARLPPGGVQPAATTGLGELLAGLALPATARLDEQPAVLELLLPQPPAARLKSTSRVTLATVGRLTKHLI
jgi:hypothetical protein